MQNSQIYSMQFYMLLGEARKSNLVFHNVNNRHLFGLLEILLAPEENAKDIKNKAIAYADEHEIETNVAMAAAGAAKCKIDYQMLSKRGAVDMSSVFDELAKESKAEGIIETCLDLQIPKQDIIEKLKKKLNISEMQALKYYSTLVK